MKYLERFKYRRYLVSFSHAPARVFVCIRTSGGRFVDLWKMFLKFLYGILVSGIEACRFSFANCETQWAVTVTELPVIHGLSAHKDYGVHVIAFDHGVDHCAYIA